MTVGGQRMAIGRTGGVALELVGASINSCYYGSSCMHDVSLHWQPQTCRTERHLQTTLDCHAPAPACPNVPVRPCRLPGAVVPTRRHTPMPRSSAWVLVTPQSHCLSSLQMQWQRQLQAWPPVRVTAGEGSAKQRCCRQPQLTAPASGSRQHCNNAFVVLDTTITVMIHARKQVH